MCSKCEILLKCCPKCEKVLKGAQNAKWCSKLKKCSKSAQHNRERPSLTPTGISEDFPGKAGWVVIVRARL